MGVFKDIFDNFLSKLNIDMNGTIDKDGIKFSITRKEKSKGSSDAAFQICIAGYGNPFGGVVVTVLETKNGILLAPKFKDDSTMFVLLNGMLLPKNEDTDGKVLWDYLSDKSDNNPPAGLSKKYYRTVKKELDNGMTVTYWHIPASEMQEYFKQGSGEFDDDRFLDTLADHVITRMLPEGMTMTFMIDPHIDIPILDRLNTMVDIDYPAERKKNVMEYNPEAYSSIPQSLTLYIYTNILNDIKKQVETDLKIKLGDVPFDAGGQKEWLTDLERRLKPEKWNQLVDNWVV